MRRTVVAFVAALGLAACQDFAARPPRASGDTTILTDTGGSTGTGKGGGDGKATASPSPAPSSTPGLLTRVESPWATVSIRIGGTSGDGGSAAELPARSKVGFAVAGGMAVLAGGLTASGLILDEFATASTALTTSWATASLPIRICDMGMGVDSLGRFVMVGGVTQVVQGGERTNSQSRKVYIGVPDAAGNLNWTEGASLPVARTAMGFTSFQGRLYVVAGQPDPPRPGEVATDSVLVGSVDAGGTLKWEAGPDLPESSTASLAFGPAVTVASAGGKNRIYVLGGLEATSASAEPRTKVWKAELDPATGRPVAWTAARPLPEGRAYCQAYQDGAGNLVVVAGLGPGPRTQRTMLKAAIDPTSGDLTWQTSAPVLPLPLQDFGLILSDGNVTIAGGTHVGFTEYSNEVLRLPLTN